MRQRYKWFSSASMNGTSLRRLVGGMQKEEFSEKNGFGFRLGPVRRDFVSGELIERIETVDVVESPLGEQFEFQRVVYRRAAFRLTLEAPQVELLNPTVLSRSLLTRFGELLDFELSVAPVEADPMRWLESLERQIGRVQVLALGLTGITLSDSVHASIRVEGSADVRESASKLALGRKYIVEKVKLSPKEPGIAEDIELRTGGRASGEALGTDALAALRKSLATSAAKSI